MAGAHVPPRSETAFAVERFEDVSAYRDVAEPYLVAREAEHNLLLGIIGGLGADPEADEEPPLLAVVRYRNEVVAVALRTPPWRLALSEVDDLAAIDQLAAELARAGEPLPGVVGPAAAASRFATAWGARTGRVPRRADVDGIYRLTRVIAPPQPAGRWRMATRADVPVLAAWLDAFAEEAVPHDPRSPDTTATVERWLTTSERLLYVWEVDDEIVSLVAVGSPTPNGIRLGPVYTPPDRRGRGYASALTAAASQDQLDRGRSFCFLYTDRANPISNRIYRAVGYEPIGEAEGWAFE